jgi:hypothetical protein
MFAGSPVADWPQPARDPPDVLADLGDGRKVAVELTFLLDESRMGREKKVEIVEASFRDAIQPELRNETERIFLVWLAPKRRNATCRLDHRETLSRLARPAAA